MNKALYRVFRPQTFDEVKDQESITRVLKNQVYSGNIGHAYLFSGSRGTGKTSCAKIFSRAVNCLHPVAGNPCNECENCRAILEETTMDVVEMDAASNRGIDDVRDLRDKVIYPPTQLKYKVYIIDEAHMITNDAFNALLKIMEEPPAHLIFILATTELEKIPVTILSRTQRYEFKRIDLQAIEDNVRAIAGRLDRLISDEAARSIAVAADGAMRDALSLLDQVLTAGHKEITQETVDAVLGTVGFASVYELAGLIFDNDARPALKNLGQLMEGGKDPLTFLKEFIDYFRLLLLYKSTGDSSLLNIDEVQAEKLAGLAGKVDLQRLLDSIDILLDTEQWTRKSDFPDLLLESAVVKLINYRSVRNLLSRLEAVEDKLKAVQRWQVPENLIRNEVRQLLEEGRISLAGPDLQPAPVQGRVDESSTGGKESADIIVPDPAEREETVYDEGEDRPQSEGAVDEPESAGDPEESATPRPEPAEIKSRMKPAAVGTGQSVFDRDPLGWIRDNEEEFFDRITKTASIRKEIMMRYEDVQVRADRVFFIYSERESFIRQVVNMHVHEIEEILAQMVGSYRVTVTGPEDLPAFEESSGPGQSVPTGPSEPAKSAVEATELSVKSEEDRPLVAEAPLPGKTGEYQAEAAPEEEGAVFEEDEEAGRSQDPIESRLRSLFPPDVLEISAGDENR